MSITPLSLDDEHAIQLGDALCHGAVAAKGTANSLVLSLGGKLLGFNGWNSYINVVGATHNAIAQAKHTTLLYRGEAGMLQRLRAGLPGYDALERMALDACPGMQVAFIHVLQQSSAQACFNWHTDTQTEGYSAVRKTMVVLLTDTTSSMQIEGEPEFVYPGVGAAALFDSDRIHRSGQASAGTLKVALMLKPMDMLPSVASTTACAGSGAGGGVLGKRCVSRASAHVPAAVLAPCCTVSPIRLQGTDTDADPPCDTIPEVDPSTIGDGGGVTRDGVCKGGKRKSKELLELEKQQTKWTRKDGAILAPSRTAEGYSLPSGNQMTCKPDALFNGLKTHGFENASLARLRSHSVPKLGIDPMASWSSIDSALTTLGYPFSIKEATSRFKGEGGPLLNLLRAPRGVYLVSLLVIVDGVRNKHCVMLSTLKEKRAPFGKLIDNHGKMRPTYMEKKDTRGKESAKEAWKLFISQNPATHDRSFTVEPIDVYELVSL